MTTINPGPVMVGELRYGTILATVRGYVFIPNGIKLPYDCLGRKAHATTEACLPPWVRAALKQHAKETK